MSRAASSRSVRRALKRHLALLLGVFDDLASFGLGVANRLLGLLLRLAADLLRLLAPGLDAVGPERFDKGLYGVSHPLTFPQQWRLTES